MPICGQVLYPALEWCTDGHAAQWMADRIEPVHKDYHDIFPGHFKGVSAEKMQECRRELWSLAMIGAIELGILRNDENNKFIEVIPAADIQQAGMIHLFEHLPAGHNKRDGTPVSYELPILVNFKNLVQRYLPPDGVRIHIGDAGFPAEGAPVTSPYGRLRVIRWADLDDTGAGLTAAPRAVLLDQPISPPAVEGIPAPPPANEASEMEPMGAAAMIAADPVRDETAPADLGNDGEGHMLLPKDRSRPLHQRRGYYQADLPLCRKMDVLIKDGTATGRWSAALAVVDSAKGGGNVDSRAKRLMSHYEEASKNGDLTTDSENAERN